MGSNLIRYLCVLMVLFSTLQLGERPKSAAQTEDQDVQVISMIAKKYEFSPSPVHVKAGMRIQLKITAIDRDHGFKMAVVPEGADAPIYPGLDFDPPQGNNGWKLKKSEETKIEFVAKTAGTYEFRCSVACGIHHGRMKGQLVVDP
jgi:heme/copper-type cytochrome/quinol oxidase subunit 2